MKRVSIVVVAGALLLPGCETNEQTGALLGGVSGAAIGATVADAFGGNDQARVIAAGLGGVAGASLGGRLGAQLDERDRRQAAAATQAALDLQAERDARLAAEARAARAEAEAARQRAARAADQRAAEQAAQEAEAARRRAAAAERERQQVTQPAQTSWTSQSGTGARGGSTVVSGAGANCYTVREVAVVPGRGEVAQNQRYCNRGGGWQPA